MNATQINPYSVVTPFPIRGDSNLYGNGNKTKAMKPTRPAATAFENGEYISLGSVDNLVSFHIYQDDELACILNNKCKNDVSWPLVREFCLTNSL